MDIRLLRHLVYFATVAQEGSFARGAARLGISQPPLSQQILTLESQFGAKLLNRSRAGVTPTAAGRALLPQIHRVLEEADKLEHLVADLRAGKIARIAIGGIGTAVQDVLPMLTRETRTAFPDLTLDLIEEDSAALIDGLHSAQLDLALLRADDLGPDLRVTKVQTAPLALALPKQSSPLSSSTLSWRDIEDHSLIQCRRDVSPAFFDAIQAACREEGGRLHVVKEVGSISSQIAMVACGMGAAVVPDTPSIPVPDTVSLISLAPAHTVTTLALAIRQSDAQSTIAEVHDLWQALLASPDPKP